MKVPPPLPSERKFRLFFSAVLGAFAVWLWRSGRLALAGTLLALALRLLIASLLVPCMVQARNGSQRRRAPIVLGAMRVLIFVRVGLARRVAGRDPLRRRHELLGNSAARNHGTAHAAASQGGTAGTQIGGCRR